METVETLNQYQDLASRTAKFSPGNVDGLTYTALGLNGEAGELLEAFDVPGVNALMQLLAAAGTNKSAGKYAEVIKKMLRDDGGELEGERKQKALLELGDVLWYLSQSARLAGFTLQEVAEANIAKLSSRNKRGQIHGDGDDR